MKSCGSRMRNDFYTKDRLHIAYEMLFETIREAVFPPISVRGLRDSIQLGIRNTDLPLESSNSRGNHDPNETS